MTAELSYQTPSDQAASPFQGKIPLEVGNKVLIRTATHYHVGKIQHLLEKGGVPGVVLEQASWVADTGRFTNCLTTENGLKEVEPFPDPVWVSLVSAVDITFWRHALPTVDSVRAAEEAAKHKG